MNNLHAVDIAVIISYLILCLVIGLYKAGKIKTMREYTLGTGRISTTILLFTLFATHIDAGSTVGFVEKIYGMGLIFVAAVVAEPLLWLVAAKIFAGNISIFKRAGCISVSGIMGFLYGEHGKWVTNVFSMFLAIGAIATQISAIGYLFNYFLGIPQYLGVSLGFGVLVIYSLFGGIRAVAFTDTFQGLMLLIAIPVACAIALHEFGGYDAVISSLPTEHLSISFTQDNTLLLASMIFYSILPVSAGTYIQRFLMANDSAQLSKALKTISLISFPFALVICLIGFIVKVKAPEIDPNTAFFYLIGNYLPIGITGLLITGLLAAIMSTADSWLNTTSVLCAHDIVKGIFPNITDRQELLIARISVLVISMLSMALAFSGESIMELIWLADSFWQPVIFIPLAAGFLKFQTNQKSFIASTVMGITATLITRYITGEFATVTLLFGTLASAIGLFGMHYLQLLSGQKFGKVLFAHAEAHKREAIKLSPIAIFTKYLKEQASGYKNYAHLLSGLGMIYFLGSSFFMAFTDMKVLYAIIYMKAAAAILCFGLSIYELHLTHKQQAKYMPIYWSSVLCYCFPFLSGYIALVYDYSMPWLVNLMLSTILLYLFGGFFSMLTLSAIGFAAAYLLFTSTGYSLAVIDITDKHHMLGYMYCFLTAGIILMLKQRDILQAKELETRVLYGAAVAHEVVNPLQGAAMMADTLLKAFGSKNVEDLNKQEFNEIKELLAPFKASSIGALQTVDRMLTLVRTDISKADDIGVYNIEECVEKALKGYGVNNENVSNIKIDARNSFRFRGSKHFVSHCISNLISNALKYAGDGSEINIWYQDNALHFADNGNGIDAEEMPYIFEPFNKKGSTKGTGVGLPFCKKVMESMNGSIECVSTPETGTEFVLTFDSI